MAVDPSDRMGVMRTSRVEEAPNPGPWPQATPVAEVSQLEEIMTMALISIPKETTVCLP